MFKWKFIWYNGALIMYRNDADGKHIYCTMKVIYIVSIGSYIVGKDKYRLSAKNTVETLLKRYKMIVDGYNSLTKK
jgi:hypothetical protein